MSVEKYSVRATSGLHFRGKKSGEMLAQRPGAVRHRSNTLTVRSFIERIVAVKKQIVAESQHIKSFYYFNNTHIYNIYQKHDFMF